MIVQKTLAQNYNAIKTFQKSFKFGVICAWVNIDDSLFYFGFRKTIMRILCIENKCEVY